MGNMNRRSICNEGLSAFLIAALLFLGGACWWESSAAASAPQAAPPRASAPKAYFQPHWLPKYGGPKGLHYVGARLCITCHVYEANELKTPMAHASLAPAATPYFIAHPQAQRKIGQDLFRFDRSGGREIYSVSRGGKTWSQPLLWTMGQGVLAQTYVYKAGHRYYEGRVSLYTHINQLDVTMGDAPLPASLPDALGRRLGEDELRSCFVCHTTGSYLGGMFNPRRATAGVTCEECHGPGSAHVAAMRAQRYATPHIYNPGKLTAGGMDQFCGACHRTGNMVFEMGITGIEDLRFQSYRLSLSSCYNPDDGRISCVACHDPHQPLVKYAGWYDAKCLACHVRQGQAVTVYRPGKACPVAQKHCVTCHMPRLKLPGSHARFADHYIRITRPGEAYPG